MEYQFRLEETGWLEGLEREYVGGVSFFLQAWAGELKSDIVRGTPRDDFTEQGRRKSFGQHIQDSWQVEAQAGGLEVVIGTDFSYGPTLEEGKYPRIGPRTIATGGGIYSRQAPEGIIKPLIKNTEFLQDAMDRVILQVGDNLDKFLERRTA